MTPTRANLAPRSTMRRIVALAAAATVVLAACGASAAGPASTATTAGPAAPGAGAGATATADVGIQNFKFTPAALTVKVGTTVVWTNKDTVAHSVNFTTGGINSSTLDKNDQFTFTFTMPGSYAYICSIHPFMHGSVTVTA